jgi:hypothetical protein
MIKLTDTGRALVEKVLPEVYGGPRAYDGYSPWNLNYLKICCAGS